MTAAALARRRTPLMTTIARDRRVIAAEHEAGLAVIEARRLERAGAVASAAGGAEAAAVDVDVAGSAVGGRLHRLRRDVAARASDLRVPSVEGQPSDRMPIRAERRRLPRLVRMALFARIAGLV